jgi:hypothetical protein
MNVNVKEVSVTRHINLLDGQSMDISVTGSVSESGIDSQSAKMVLLNVLNSGVITVLKNEIVKPIEAKFAKPVQRQEMRVI